LAGVTKDELWRRALALRDAYAICNTPENKYDEYVWLGKDEAERELNAAIDAIIEGRAVE